MKQRLHPHILWTGAYQWQDVNTDHLKDSGKLLNIEKSEDNKTCILIYKNISVLCSAIEDGIIRIQIYTGKSFENIWPDYPKFGIINNKPKNTISFEQINNKVIVSTGWMSIDFNSDFFAFEVFNFDGNSLLKCLDAKIAPSKHGLESIFEFEQSNEDHYHGFGGRTEKPDRKGYTFDQFATKVWEERGDYGGFPMPFFLNPKGYSFILNNPYEHVYFDMGYEDDKKWFFYTPDGPIDIYISAGKNYPELLGKYYQLTGKPTLPPKWMFGFWVSWFEEWVAQDWVDWMQRFREEGWPSDVAELDAYWRGGEAIFFVEAGEGKNIGWEYETFGDGPKMLRDLLALGVHTCLHLNTRMFSGEVLEEGLEKGFLRRASEEQVVPVLTTKESVEWNWAMHKSIVEDGADVWWTDNGERVDGQITDALPSRNIFGNLWNKFYFDNMEEMGRKGHLTIARGGWFGTHTHTLPWPGDTQPGVDRTQEDLNFMLNLSMSGVPFTTVDLGGFCEQERNSTDVMHRDENTIRRTIHGFLMAPVPRIHNTRSQAKFPWNYREEIQELYRHFLTLRYRLFPYFYSASVNAIKNNVPVMRPLLFDYSDAKTINIFDEFMMGDSILIAPMMVEGRTDRRVYLPEGKWVHYWSKEIYEGGREYIIDAPLFGKDGLPMFVKLNSIIPYCPDILHVPDEDFNEITLEIYTQSKSDCIEYDLWEDGDRCTKITFNNGKVIVDKQANVERTYKVVFPLLPQLEPIVIKY